jgi:hypothetical protein
MPIVRINADRLTTWSSFHDTFAEAFGFPSYYGRNMNAWIDLMTDLEGGTSDVKVHASPTDPTVIRVDNVDAMPAEIFQALVECAAFVNWRRLETGDPAMLILAFHKSSP